MKIALGIDPGVGGAAVAILEGNVHVHNFSTPADARDFLLLWLSPANQLYAVLEEVGPMPLDGRASLAKFMKNAGGWEWLLTGLKIPTLLIKPVAWQKELGLSKTKKETKEERKRRLREAAQRMFPAVNVTLKCADALLLAELARRKMPLEEHPAVF
jgi:hypothetical protein